MEEDETGNTEMTEVPAGTTCWEKQRSMFWTMFPLVSTKEALQEKHFARGYAYSSRLYAMRSRSEWNSMRQYPELALTEYQRSYEETKTPEAVANLLWALCVGYVSAVDEDTPEMLSDEDAQSYRETGLLLIDILREFQGYEALAEYYLALQYMIGMSGNRVRVEENKAVGVEMMKLLVLFGNTYATRLAAECKWTR